MTADEMLKELGYEKTMDFEDLLVYQNLSDESKIHFWLKENPPIVSLISTSPRVLKAVTEKCRELGWLSKEDE